MRFGNVFKAGSSTYSPSSYNAQTNQPVSGVKASYDANGNETMTTLVASMSYDANHNAVAAGSTGLTYDAFGRLVEFGGKAVVYGPSGEKLGVFNGTTNTMAFMLPGGSEALYTTGALTSLRRKDWLGSSRVSTSWTHAVVSKAAYAPFGESYATSGTGDLDFTGQTQDSVSTLYDFPARKYDYISGRWTSPDPGAWSVVDPTNPQSFNRYAYVIDNPVKYVDPRGLNYFVCATSGASGCSDVSDIEYLTAYGTYMAQSAASGDSTGYKNEAITNYAGMQGLTAFTTNGMLTATAQYFDPSTSPFGNGMAVNQGFSGNPHANDGQQYGPSGNSGTPAPNNGTPQQPQQSQQQPKKQPWFCGTGNSWSHPFTAPTGKQWGIWSTSDLLIAAGISKFTGGKDPVSQVFIDAGLLEAYGWAKCD